MTIADLPAAAIKHGRSDTQSVDRHIAARMRERRTMLGLTLQQVAGLLGITYQQLYKYEKGVNRISAGRLLAFARALGVEPAHFFEGLGAGGPPRPTAQQRRLLELAESFVALPRWQQEALLRLVRALAEADAGPGREEAGDDGPT